jgi:uncharacterized peroxidase-related enzyme
MAYIHLPDMNEVDESVRVQLEAVEKKKGEVGEIARILSLRPDIYNMTTMMLKTLLVSKTELNATAKESIAILVSKLNSCEMCVGEHQRVARMLGMTEKQVDEVLAGIEHMDIPANERALMEFCVKSAGKENYKITQKDIDALRDAGYSDSQILEATTIVAYFNYINTISNSLGAGKPGDGVSKDIEK